MNKNKIQSKLASILRFLISQHGEESAYLISLANQNDMSLDQKPLRFKKEDFNVNFPEQMIDKGESCDMVNFGIGSLQKEKISQKLKKKKIYIPEDVNFVHFDLEKLYRCMESNEFSKKLYNIFVALSRASSSFDMTVDKFLSSLKDFPMVKEAFEEVLATDSINYLVIGTSDSSYNFIGTEVAAQKFHQLTVNHVMHDLGHATYDFPGNTADGDSDTRVGARFRPIGILAKYVVEVIQYFESLKAKASKRSGKKMSMIDQGKLSGMGESHSGFSFNNLQQLLRRHSKFYDVRYLVGTRGSGENKNSKSFTDKGDFDQDLFSYIMQIEEGQSVSDVFSSPTMPKGMRVFFDRMSDYLDENDMENFVSYINEKHSQAISMVEEDLNRVSEAMISDSDSENASPAQGYLTYLTQDLGERPQGAPLFIFNMIDPRGGLSYISKDREKNLSEKKYIDPDEGAQGRIITFDDKGKKTTKMYKYFAIANLVSDNNKPITIFSSTSNGQEFAVGDVFKISENNSKHATNNIIRDLMEPLEYGAITYNEKDEAYTIVATKYDDGWDESALKLRYSYLGDKTLDRTMLRVVAPSSPITDDEKPEKVESLEQVEYSEESDPDTESADEK